MNGALGIVGFLAFMAFGIAHLIAGFAGIEQGIGSIWAWIALFAALALRFTLPITVGAFFGAMNVWGWHWALAALFAAPGLLLVIPGALASVLSLVTVLPNRHLSSSQLSMHAEPAPKISDLTPLPNVVDEDRIYSIIASELEGCVADKGLWTRLFAECGGDEKQTKVLYIRQRADRLIAAENARIDRAVNEYAAEAVTAEKARQRDAADLTRRSEGDAIAHAIFSNNIETVRTLIARGVDVNLPNEYGVTPLRMAKNCERQEILDLLVQAGARE